MLGIRMWIAVAALGLGCESAAVEATVEESDANGTLTPADYMEIQQLVAKYAFALDNCSNGGQDYADLYTENGVFVYGVTGQEWRGREQLIEAAGGPDCERLKRLPYMSHTTANVVIEPSPEGATGKSYLVYPGQNGNFFDAVHTGHAGGYQDVYVKTPQGWRIQSRVSVYPPQIPGQYKVPNDQLEASVKK